MSDGLAVPLQVQVIEPELCPHTYNAQLASGNRVRAGIEFNAIGKRVAYWFYTSRPGDYDDYDPSQLRRVPAEFVRHMYDPLRPGQLRGVPHLTQALIRLFELDKFDDATLLRQQLQNLFVAFLTRPPSNETATTHPLTGLDVETTDDGQPMLSLEPGAFQELDPGEDVKFSAPPSAGSEYKVFSSQQLRHAAAAIGIPYETLTGDMSGVNDRTVRVILQEFRRRVLAWQHQIVAFQVCRPMWNAWIDRGYVTGTLPVPAGYRTNPEPWRRVKFMPHAWPYLHPVQDVEAQRAAVRSGFTTRTAVVGEQGEDANEIDQEQAADNQRADDLKLTYDSDGRQALKASATPANPDTGSGTPATE